jgi:hypothetical protein
LGKSGADREPGFAQEIKNWAAEKENRAEAILKPSANWPGAGSLCGTSQSRSFLLARSGGEVCTRPASLNERSSAVGKKPEDF